jgi:hypothetical protein
MLETSVQTKVAHYIQAVLPTPRKIAGLFEVKVVTSGNFSVNMVLKHQQKSLKGHEQAGTYWKISDSDPRKKPGDFMVATGHSWLVVYFVKTKYAYFCKATKVLGKNKIYTEKEIECLADRKVIL